MANETKIQGSRLLLGWIDYPWNEENEDYDEVFRVFGFAKSCELSQSRETKEIANPTDGQWKKYIAGRCDWSCSCECLLSSDSSAVEEIFRSGQPVEILLRGRYIADWRFIGSYRGEAIITSLKITGRIHEMATYSISLKGTGELIYLPPATIALPQPQS